MDLNNDSDQSVNEIAEDRLWLHDPDGPSWVDIENPIAKPKKRGPKKIPELWTRVVSISQDKPEDLEIHVISTDKETADERLYYPQHDRTGRQRWKLLFHPKQYSIEHEDMQLE